MYVLDWCDVCTGLGVMYVLDWCDVCTGPVCVVCTGPPHINSMDLNSRLCIW